MSSDAILETFLDYLTTEEIEPYTHQEEAILELYEGKNVILNTPTGSGKSLVALALHFQALCQGKRSYYTVPIKALANEKFLSLCEVFGPENVGMITGDATVNASAPIVCCTAEILANLALREGADADVDDVIMDEFHYYSDHSRGSAWQIPLLILPQARFLLMSATLGETSFFEKTLTDLTGKPTTLIQSEDRPVPLVFTYSEDTLEEKVAELVEQDKAPIYLVNFTQLACARTAQNLLSTNFCTKEEKRAIIEALAEADFRSPYGKEVSKLLRHGVGIHHAGLLPKYRVLVEKLTQRGLLKVICGTDTLGVGVNVPIRTVLFTQLCKYDGQGTRILSVRDFKQICGRAGRRGFDSVGYVVAQAPEHVIENRRLEAKAGDNPKKRRKIVKRKPPEKGFIAWDEATFQRLITAPPEKLVSRFTMTHNILLHVLSRKQEDGCLALRRIIADCHQPQAEKPLLKKQACRLFKGLVQGQVLTIIPPHERTGSHKVILNVELQEDFTLNQTLGLYLLNAIGELDSESASYASDLLTIIEAILEHPIAILRKQTDKLKSELVASMKADGIEYEERMERLDEVEWPKPNQEFLYDTFNRFAAKHPWLDGSSIKPKSIAREMLENYQSFEDYIVQYELQRSEAVLLRHLTEVYKVLAQTVPPAAKTEEVEEAEAFFENLVRGVDSSLIDEWERLRDPDYVPTTASERTASPKRTPALSRNKPAFTRLVRKGAFDLLKALSQQRWQDALSLVQPKDLDDVTWDTARLKASLEAYLEGHELLRLDPEARNRKHTYIDEQTKLWQIDQVLVDPDELNDWVLKLSVDLAASDASKHPVFTLIGLAPVVDH
ncbi:MAG: DUF3516 domain-containing protein [Verrucomicrobiales bacterium]